MKRMDRERFELGFWVRLLAYSELVSCEAELSYETKERKLRKRKLRGGNNKYGWHNVLAALAILNDGFNMCEQKMIMWSRIWLLFMQG